MSEQPQQPIDLDALDIDLTTVQLHATLPLFRAWKIAGGVIVDELAWRKVLDGCRYFDALTYSANGEAAAKCRRLVANKLWGEFPPTCQIRQVDNMHTKLFIVRGQQLDVWVGSRNLVLADSYHNVMVQVQGEQAETLKLYFKRVWNMACQFGRQLQ